MIKLFVAVCILACLIEPSLSQPSELSGSYPRSTRKAYKSNFKNCCALGKLSSNSSSCNDFTDLSDRSSGCQYAFTICCNQNKRSNECERGKKHAYSGLPCADLKKDSYCDALTDCCNCCELGIQTRKSGDDCTSTPELSAECNSIFMDCCKYATSCKILIKIIYFKQPMRQCF